MGKLTEFAAKNAPGIGLATGAIGLGASVAQMISEKRKQRDAERSATEAVAEARKTMEVNRAEGIEIPLEAYELSERAVTAQQMQATEALRESGQRAVAAGVGKVAASSADVIEQIRQRMAEDLFKRETLVAESQAKIDQRLAYLSLKEAEGAQVAAAQAQETAAMSLKSGVEGLGNVFGDIASLAPLYGKKPKPEGTVSTINPKGVVKPTTPKPTLGKLKPITKD